MLWTYQPVLEHFSHGVRFHNNLRLSFLVSGNKLSILMVRIMRDKKLNGATLSPDAATSATINSALLVQGRVLLGRGRGMFLWLCVIWVLPFNIWQGKYEDFKISHTAIMISFLLYGVYSDWIGSQAAGCWIPQIAAWLSFDWTYKNQPPEIAIVKLLRKLMWDVKR